MFDVNSELDKIKSSADRNEIGMILVHNGIVRGTPRNAEGAVDSLSLSYDKNRLQKAIDDTYKKSTGVKKVVVWINEGRLSVGEDMMYVIVAGDRRSNILKPFEELIEKIKNNVVEEKEELLNQ